MKTNKNLTSIMTQQRVADIIKEAGESLWGYKPSVSDMRVAADLVKTGYLTRLKYLRLNNLDLLSLDEADIKSLLSVCTDRVTIKSVIGCGLIFKHVNSKELWIKHQTLSASETADLSDSLRERVERVALWSNVTLDAIGLKTLLETYPDNISVVTPELAKEYKAEIRTEAGEKDSGYSPPSQSEIRVAADLVTTGYLTKLKNLLLEDLDLLSSDEGEGDIKSLLSVCPDRVVICNLRGCGLIIKHVNSKELWIKDQTLSASETADLVTSMRDRVERVELRSGVTLDVETVDRMIEQLRQGTCREIVCWDNKEYKEYLTRWADSLGWRSEGSVICTRIRTIQKITSPELD